MVYILYKVEIDVHLPKNIKKLHVYDITSERQWVGKKKNN